MTPQTPRRVGRKPRPSPVQMNWLTRLALAGNSGLSLRFVNRRTADAVVARGWATVTVAPGRRTYRVTKAGVAAIKWSAA